MVIICPVQNQNLLTPQHITLGGSSGKYKCSINVKPNRHDKYYTANQAIGISKGVVDSLKAQKDAKLAKQNKLREEKAQETVEYKELTESIKAVKKQLEIEEENLKKLNHQADFVSKKIRDLGKEK